jgi:hypothetical protein
MNKSDLKNLLKTTTLKTERPTQTPNLSSLKQSRALSPTEADLIKHRSAKILQLEKNYKTSKFMDRLGNTVQTHREFTVPKEAEVDLTGTPKSGCSTNI